MTDVTKPLVPATAADGSATLVPGDKPVEKPARDTLADIVLRLQRVEHHLNINPDVE